MSSSVDEGVLSAFPGRPGLRMKRIVLVRTRNRHVRIPKHKGRDFVYPISGHTIPRLMVPRPLHSKINIPATAA